MVGKEYYQKFDFCFRVYFKHAFDYDRKYQGNRIYKNTMQLEALIEINILLYTASDGIYFPNVTISYQTVY